MSAQPQPSVPPPSEASTGQPGGLAAIAEMVPLSRTRAADVAQLRATADERFVPVR
ncbi:MAG: hypothetical protein HY827_03330 [Actinobacteria bacterium]|nr:hypothetical protein [Actinomycetota bacterium]